MAITKITGSETEIVCMVESRDPPSEIQAGVSEIVALLRQFEKMNPTLPICGERERGSIDPMLDERNFRGTPEELLSLRRLKKEIAKVLASVTFSPTEGLATSSGGRIYMEVAGPFTEWCTPPCTLPSEVVMQERLLECAFARSARALSGKRGTFRLYKNSSDGKGHSFGLHTNFFTTRECRERIFSRQNKGTHKLLARFTIKDASRELQDLISFFVLRLPLVCSGKPVSERYGLPCHYQMSQRADHIVELVGGHTTSERPLVNTRNEPLAPNVWNHTRLHDINSEGSNRSPLARKLSIGLTQIFLSMIEDDMLSLDWFLAEPLHTLLVLSRDLTLSRPISVVKRLSGLLVERRPTELLWDIARQMEHYAAVTALPRELADLIGVFQRIIGLLQENSPELSQILDWKIKERFIQNRMRAKGLNPDNHQHWDSPYVQGLHIQYHCLTDERFWKAAAEICEVQESEDYFEEEISDVLFPPDTTSAFLKGFLVSHPYLSRLIEVFDWHRIAILLPGHARAMLDIDPRVFHKRLIEDLRAGLGMIDTSELAKTFFARLMQCSSAPTRGLMAPRQAHTFADLEVQFDDYYEDDDNDLWRRPRY